ncbi:MULTISPECIES: dCTP deaminase [Halorussus]|uniref:dCTP deaminase n=1 Tax=Halorussus TaxID=1070314 RepID=UPI000E212B5D|nr:MULTISPECIES: dCTP deaminase [Halorussus]NHN61271.1 dCTP deaminase [Halorussus sp. JP-T4]
MRPSELTTLVDGLLHEETQVTDRGVDLTVNEVLRVETPGRVDFGGDELDDPNVSAHEKVWRSDDDDYQWWHLAGGQYLVEYNETVAADRPLRVQTRDAVREMGAFHPTLELTDLGRIPLSVAPGGIRLKENARISTVLPPEEGSE